MNEFQHIAGAALLGLALSACAPQLSGIPCALTGSEANDCPSGQACVAAGDGGAVCVSGASFADSGTADAGDGGLAMADGGSDAGRDGGPDGGTDAGNDAGVPVFAGTVVLNGGAVPVRNSWIYGFDSVPVLGTGQIPTPDLFTTADAGGDWAVSGTVTTSPYYFYAQYDIAGTGNSQQINPGDFFGAAPLTGITQPNALDLPIDVETSTCFTFTVEIQPPNLTVLFGVGAEVLDIGTDKPFTHATDLTTAAADFDAGGAPFPDAGVPPATLSLSPTGAVPGNPTSDNWVYAVPTGTLQLLSNQGSFLFTLSDLGSTAHAPSQYPAGTCRVGYSEPPAFPTAAVFGNPGALNANDTFTWSDANVTLTPDETFVGDLLAIYDASGTEIYSTPSGQVAVSPTAVPKSDFTTAGCGALSGKSCISEVVSIYSVVRDARSTAIEGGAVQSPFQTN